MPWAGLMDWGGLYDRHLVMPREAADVILGGWRLLRSGQAVRMLVLALGEQLMDDVNGTNTETWLAVRSMFAQIPASRFPMTGYVACDHEEWGAAGSTTTSTSSSVVVGVHGAKSQKEDHETSARWSSG